MGQLQVVGPTPSLQDRFACVRGQACDGLEPVVGVGLSATDQILAQSTRCGTTGRNWAKGTTQLRGTSLVLNLGILHLEADAVGAFICWCAVAADSACSDVTDFNVEAGRLRLEGPYTGQAGLLLGMFRV